MLYDIFVLIAITIGLVQAFKKLEMDKKYTPWFAIFIGIILSFLAGTGIELKSIILDGLIVGLSACGLYSGTKTVLGK